MSYFNKTLEISIADLIIIAIIGGVGAYLISKLIDFAIKQFMIKNAKKLQMAKRSMKSFKEVFLMRKALKTGYDTSLYESLEKEKLSRYLFLNERKYLKKHVSTHFETLKENEEAYIRRIEGRFSPKTPPWGY